MSPELISHLLTVPYEATQDPDDGEVTLSWQKGSEAISLVFQRNGTVTVILSPYRASHPPYSITLNELFTNIKR
jgi:hypothetical protein